MGTEAHGDLKPLIRSSIPEEREKPPLTEDSWIRVSGLAMMCAREEVLAVRGEIIRADNVGADLMLIFEHGNGLHWDLQNRILPQTKTLFGRWLCAVCGTHHGGRSLWGEPDPEETYPIFPDEPERDHTFEDSQILRPEVCPKCGSVLTSDNSIFEEQWIKDPEYRLAGHPDGFLRLEGMPGLGVLEVKSISPRGAYEVRTCAKLDHVTQAQCYMWMTGCQWGKVLYWDKGTGGMKGLIEHTVEYDEDHVEAMQNLVRDIWTGVKDETSHLPERICASSDCKRADLCACVEPCFEAD